MNWSILPSLSQVRSAKIAAARRPLVQPMDRHHGKQLLHGPVVRRRLEDREVAVVGVGEALLEVFEIVGDVGKLADDPQDLLAAIPEQPLDARPSAQVEVAEGEQRRGFLLELERVVVRLLDVLARDAGPDLGEILENLGIVFAHRLGRLARDHLVHAEYVEDQHRVVRDHRTAGLGDDVGVWKPGVVTRLLDERDDVVGVLLHRVVHRRVEVGLRPVVVDAEAAADVEDPRGGAHLVKAGVDPARLPQGILVGADRRDLRSDVEVEQLEAVEHVLGAEPLDGLDDLRRRKAELRAVSRRLDPLAGALGREPCAHPEVRPDAELAGGLHHQLDLVESVDDDDRVAADPLGEERRLDVGAVLVAVADDERARRVEERQRDQQLGLAPGLEAAPKGAPYSMISSTT